MQTEFHKVGSYWNWGFRDGRDFTKSRTLRAAFQAEMVVVEATANNAWGRNCQQSSLESCVKGSDVRELGGKD